MSVFQVPRQSSWAALVRARRVQGPLPRHRTGTTPGPSLPLLAARLAKWRGPHQRLARVGPPIRVGMLGVLLVQKAAQPLLELRRRGKVAPLEEPPRQHAEPQLHLVQPGPMFRGEYEAEVVGRVRQECTPLSAVLQGPRTKRPAVECRQDLTGLQTPVRIQVVQDPG